jgi:hypothetical protein
MQKTDSLKKVKTKYLIQNGNTFLKYNDSLFRKDFYFADKKVGATMFPRDEAERVIRYLKKEQGLYNVKKIRAKH